MNKSIKIAIGATAALLICLICVCGWLFSGSGSSEYYTQIDNSKIEHVNSSGGVIDLNGGQPYAYTLASYDKDGKEKAITFGTSRELREGAFLQLTVMPVRGVIDWSEVQYEELLAAVQDHYRR